VGLILRYTLPGNAPSEFLLAVEGNSSSNCSEMELSFEVGQSIQVNTLQDSFTCAIQGKVFKDASGSFIRTTVSEGEGKKRGVTGWRLLVPWRGISFEAK